MADLPISFSKPMVQALLAGRKTQTRRLMPHQEALEVAYLPIISGVSIFNYAGEELISRPPIKRGDRLYVREHWRAEAVYDETPPRDIEPDACNVFFEADGKWSDLDQMNRVGRFRQAMHMPRWASRLTNIVTEVRVQRLQDITEEDAIAEGVEPLHTGYFPYGITTFLTTFVGDREVPAQCCRTAKHSYEMLWNSLHGPNAWDANPWVAAYSFAVQHGNIDTQ